MSRERPAGPVEHRRNFDTVEVVPDGDAVAINDQQRAMFAADGFIVLHSVLDAAARRALVDAIDASRASPSSNYRVLSAAGMPRVDSDLFRSDLGAIHELSRSSLLPRAAAGLLGSGTEVVFVEDQWFASGPGASTVSPWHQDSPYYAIDSPFVTMWCPIDPVPEAAALRVVPGSHRWGKHFAPVEFAAEAATLSAGSHRLDPVPDIRPEAAVVARACAGDVVAFDARLLHSAGGYVDHDFRRFSLRYAGPDARFVRPAWPIASFWDELPHGLQDGDPLACTMFPLIDI